MRRPCGTDFKSRIRWRFGARQPFVLAKSFYPEQAFERCARSEATNWLRGYKKEERAWSRPCLLGSPNILLGISERPTNGQTIPSRPLGQVASRRPHPTTSLSGSCNEVVTRSSQFSVRSSQFAKGFCDSTIDHKRFGQMDLSALTQ